MIILENVKKQNNYLKGNYRFAGYPESGSFIYDIQKKDYLEVKFGKEKNPKKVYGFSKLTYLLDMMIQHNKYPEQINCRWY